MVKLDSQKTTTLMNQQGLSVSKLAHLAYLPPAIVQRAINNDSVSSEVLWRIAHVLGVKRDTLVTKVFRHCHWYPASAADEPKTPTVDEIISAIVALCGDKKMLAETLCHDLYFAAIREGGMTNA